MSNDYPSLGFDPAPGKLTSVDDLTRKIGHAAGGLESAHRTLMDITKGGKTWQGEAANAFTQNVGDLPRSLSDSVDALKQASTQLGGWRSKLADYQHKARQYEADAKAAKTHIQQQEAAQDRATHAYNQAAADPAFRLAGQTFTDQTALNNAQSKLDAAQSRLKTAGHELDAVGKRLDHAKDELDGIIKRAKELLEHHQSDARTIADKLRKANKNAPDTSLLEMLGDALQRVGHSIKEWCVKHADLLKQIGDILSTVSAALGVLSLLTMWCPPLSGALALAGGVTSLGAMATHGMAKLGGADVSAATLIGDGLGVLPFGKFATGAFKGAKVGLKLGEHGDLMLKGANTFNKVSEAAGGLKPTLQAGKLSKLGLSDDIAHFNPEGLGNKAKLAWTKHVAETGETSLKGSLYGMTITKTPLRNLPGAQAAMRVDGTLDPLSWWSRGPQLIGDSVGLGMKANRAANQPAPAAGTM
ncbi:putative T7SS-secreted protein [Streptomyces sp. NPDC001339]|uniref:putative T7SS-secreted protein n=1 Tax=Streptomyces sp. NPDC001339 TaxID=3364563 RepID=UPI0036AC807F